MRNKTLPFGPNSSLPMTAALKAGNPEISRSRYLSLRNLVNRPRAQAQLPWGSRGMLKVASRGESRAAAPTHGYRAWLQRRPRAWARRCVNPSGTSMKACQGRRSVGPTFRQPPHAVSKSALERPHLSKPHVSDCNSAPKQPCVLVRVKSTRRRSVRMLTLPRVLAQLYRGLCVAARAAPRSGPYYP